MDTIFDFLTKAGKGTVRTGFPFEELFIEYNSVQKHYEINADFVRIQQPRYIKDIETSHGVKTIKILVGLLKLSNVMGKIGNLFPASKKDQYQEAIIVISAQLDDIRCLIQTNWGKPSIGVGHHGYITAISFEKVGGVKVYYSVSDMDSSIFKTTKVSTYPPQHAGEGTLSTLVHFLDNPELKAPGSLIENFTFYIAECARFDILRDILILNYFTTKEMNVGDKMGVISEDGTRILVFSPINLASKNNDLIQETYRCGTKDLIEKIRNYIIKTDAAEFCLYKVEPTTPTGSKSDIAGILLFDINGLVRNDITPINRLIKKLSVADLKAEIAATSASSATSSKS